MTETKKLVSPPTLEQFEAITDLRPYLLQTRTDWTIDCLHYLGDDAQKWWAERQNKKDQIVESVIEKYNQRSKVGIAKYGTTLYENKHDDFLKHAQEEAMDFVLYLEKMITQIREAKKQINDR